MRKATRMAFPAGKNEVEEAENGYGALAQLSLAQQPFDIIVLDLQMPEMNGVEFIRAVRERPLHRDTPIIVASSETAAGARGRRPGGRRPRKAKEAPSMTRQDRLSDADVRLLMLAEHGHAGRVIPTYLRRPLPGARTRVGECSRMLGEDT
jgi:CheY-like chemotaxis protein